jgi:N-sulfoglucosamine sulfohydrolase
MRHIIHACLFLILAASLAPAAERPNVLIALSDDQSWPHASAYGSKMVHTPAFDRVAEMGVLFNNGFAASPGCSPCRAALLTGRHTWQLEHAGTHASSFPAKYRTFPELLGKNGYFVGYTGKGWGPGNFRIEGREQNPAGPEYSRHRMEVPYSGINRKDYASNFADFLSQKPDNQPFCFWYGSHEPHRGYQKGSGLDAGKSLDDAEVPGFLPDHPEIRSDLLDYAVEVEWFDSHLKRMLDLLEENGELENTLIIVSSDNGMPFPRAKANCYEFGIHMPLAICWPQQVPGGRTSDDLIGFVDLTATIYDVAGVEPPADSPLAGRSIREILESDREGIVDPSRTAVFSARERHSSSRYQNLGYPQRAMRTHEHLFIWNPRPERWPAGAPQKYENGELGPMHGGYHDIDPCPSLTFLVENHDHPEFRRYFHLAVDHRPVVEIFNIKDDPACLHNLAGKADFAETEATLRAQAEAYLRETGDPRILNGGDIFETYPRYSRIRSFPMAEHVQKRWDQMTRDGWQPLFDGRSLKGWTASPPEDSFEVVNGMIQAQASRDQSHLFYTGEVNGGEFTDFELLVEAMALPGGNSGVYFHTRYQEEGFPDYGHEVQINNTHHNKVKTGSLFSVQDVDESPADDEVFFTLYTKVQGKQVTVTVNDEVIVEYEEPEDYTHPRFKGRKIDRGTFALQAHDPESVVYFREIWVRAR